MRLLPPDRDLGWTPFVWLVYLGAYLLMPALLGATSAQWAVYTAGLLAFLPLYFAGYWVGGARRLPIVAAIAALGLALTWMNPGAAVFFVYAASFVGGAVSGRAAVSWVLGLAVAGLAAAWPAGPLRPFALVFVAVFTPLIGFVNLSAAALRQRDASLRLAHDEIARLARRSGRDRIATDLHDLLGHTLSVIVLKADLAARLIDRDAGRAAEEIREVARVSRQALAEVRQAVQGVHAATIADEVSRAAAVLGAAGIEVHTAIAAPLAGGSGDPAPPHEQALALVLREAVTNVLRHARASRCDIRVDGDADRLTLLVRDDGTGGPDIEEGTGWSGMRRRVEAHGGAISHERDNGFRLSASVPRRVGAEAAR